MFKRYAHIYKMYFCVHFYLYITYLTCKPFICSSFHIYIYIHVWCNRGLRFQQRRRESLQQKLRRKLRRLHLNGIFWTYEYITCIAY